MLFELPDGSDALRFQVCCALSRYCINECLAWQVRNDAGQKKFCIEEDQVLYLPI